MKRLPVLKIAVVGHTNTGKTSLLRTLTRNAGFGAVSNRPATTRHVEGASLLVDGVPLIELYDTPGLEDSIGLLEFLDKLNGGQRRYGIELIEQFLVSPAAKKEFEQEAKALRQAGSPPADRPVRKILFAQQVGLAHAVANVDQGLAIARGTREFTGRLLKHLGHVRRTERHAPSNYPIASCISGLCGATKSCDRETALRSAASSLTRSFAFRPLSMARKAANDRPDKHPFDWPRYQTRPKCRVPPPHRPSLSSQR